MAMMSQEAESTRPTMTRRLSGTHLYSRRSSASNEAPSKNGNGNGNGMTSGSTRMLSGTRLYSRRSSSGEKSSQDGHDDGNASGNGSAPSGRIPQRGGPAALRWIQDRLDFRGCAGHPQFSTNRGLGRVAMIACILGAFLAAHAMVLAQLYLHRLGLVSISAIRNAEPSTIQMMSQWCQYVVVLTSFHILEFFVTAIYNPLVTTADSFVVNQSLAYTAAALVSWVEFWVRFFFFPSVNSPAVAHYGLWVVLFGQLCRTMAMVTCGESFNHLIQQRRKDNHVLIQHGIYRFLRHPSYVGFYYWSVGTQLLLSNPICAACYTVASWFFFKKRIPYEEDTLSRYFPAEYPEYVSRTWTGIPFIMSRIKRE